MYEKEHPEESDGKPRRYIRPPGALADEAAFLSTCVRCSQCIEACPHGVIKKLTAVAGIAEGTPDLQPEKDPYHWCVDMPCITARQSPARSAFCLQRSQKRGHSVYLHVQI